MSGNINDINGLDSVMDDERTFEIDEFADTYNVDTEADTQADSNTYVADLEQQLAAAHAQISSLMAELELNNGQIDKYRQEIRELRKLVAAAENLRQANQAASNGQDASLAIGEMRLLIRDDGNASTEYVIKAGRTCLGSSPDNDIQLKNEFVSRHHAQIVSNADACILGDLNSTNGTFVNSSRVKRYALQEGDWLTIGNILFKYITRPAGNRPPASFSEEIGHQQ